jgi:hypothetical protein
MCGGNPNLAGQRMSDPFYAGQQRPTYQGQPFSGQQNPGFGGQQMSTPFSVNQPPPQMQGVQGGQNYEPNRAIPPNMAPQQMPGEPRDAYQVPPHPGMQPGQNFSYNGPNGLMYAEAMNYGGPMRRRPGP